MGIEPTSEDRPDIASTCLVDDWVSPGSRSIDRKSSLVEPEKESHSSGSGAPASQPVFSASGAAPQAGITRQTWLPLVRQPEPIRCWQLNVFPFGNEVRVPGMQLDPASYPRRNRVAPLSEFLIQVILSS